ncbi:MAG: nucleotidyltransferase family protein [Candidatus Eisenbacteria bacterium]
MKRDEVLRVLSEHRREIEKRHGVRFLALFGSVARDQASAESDIDVLVEFERAPGFDGYMQLKEHLEAVLGHRVDLVMTGALKPSVRPEIEREAIRVA